MPAQKSILPLGTAAETLRPQMLLNPALTIDPGGSLTPARCCLVPTQATTVHGSDVEISKLCSSRVQLPAALLGEGE